MNRPIKLGFFGRKSCSRKGCCCQSSYLFNNKYYCLSHAKNTKWFKKYFDLPEVNAEDNSKLQTSASGVDLNDAFRNAFKAVNGGY